MPRREIRSYLLGAVLTGTLAAVPVFAQDQYPPPGQYPQTQQYPPQGQYPPQNQNPPQSGQYPPQGQYPPPQGQPPPQQGQYPPQQGQYPPAQGQYPQPPQGQSYPAQQAPYPPQYGQPPLASPQQLDQLVQPIALYPDGLLAQALTAATFSNEIPDAANWANVHSYLRGDELARAMQQDNLGFDPSVMALLPFPSVLNYMAQYMGWTQALGNAVLAQRPDVMDAVQRMRQEAYNYGYLRNSEYDRVVFGGPGDIEILPVTPGFYYVPYYNPAVVFYRPRPGFFVGAAIRFGPGITVGAAFAPFGWANIGFGWRAHTIIVDNHPWVRTWANRGVYVHPYAVPYRHEGPRVERHESRERHEDHREH